MSLSALLRFYTDRFSLKKIVCQRVEVLKRIINVLIVVIRS